MKKFRFPLERLLELKRRELEAVEGEIQRLEAREASSRRRAASLESDGAEVRSDLSKRSEQTGADLRTRHEWMETLGREAVAAIRAAQLLDGQAAPLRTKAVELRREVKLIEELRAKRLQKYEYERSREEEALATELFLARHGRGTH